MSRSFRFLPDEFATAASAALGTAGSRNPAALLVVDVDDRNDLGVRYGATFVEKAATLIFDLAGTTIRETDLLARVPHGPILVLLTGTSANEATSVAERLCAGVRAHRFPADADEAPAITVSVGIAVAPDHATEYPALLVAATETHKRVSVQGGDGASVAAPAHHEVLHRPLAIDRFAGRTGEVALLTKALEDACAGRPRTVIVSGETGTGVTALLRQLEPEVRLRGGHFLIAAASLGDVRSPYAPWPSIIRSVNRLPDPPHQSWQELQHLAPELGEPQPMVAKSGSQYRLLEELSGYVRNLAVARPVVLVLDEMQWADVTSWDALEHLVDQLDTDRLLICVALRSDVLDSEIAERRTALKRHGIVQEISLTRLTRDEVKQWLEGAFYHQPVGREFIAFLYRHTEGNPLFATHVLRSLLEEGALWHNGERWEWSPVSELRVPVGRSALIARRLSRFSSTTMAVLMTAAIIGDEFEASVVAAAGAGSEQVIRLACSEAVAAGLLRSTADRQQGSFAFCHGDVRTVLLQSISPERRREWEANVGAALERRNPQMAAAIALHYDRGGDQAKAYRYALAAASHAETMYATSAANQYLEVAARNATSPGDLAEVRVRLAHLAETTGRHDVVEELCDLAIEWFEGQGDKNRGLTLRRMRERARMELGQPARVSLDALTALDAEAKDLGFARERVAILTLASQTHGRLGDRRTAERIAAQCVEMAEQIGDRTLLAEALNRLANTVLNDTPARAHEIYARALALFETTGDVRGQARCYGNMGVAAQFESHLDEASEAFSRSIAVARAAGMPDLWGVAALNLGVLSQKCGDYDHARELFGEALALFAAVKNSEFQLFALYNMGHVERELGLWDAAAELYEATIPLAQRIGQSDVELGATAGAGLSYLESGNADQASAYYRDVVERMQSRPDWFQGREIYEALAVRVAALEGRQDEAIQRLKRALDLAESADVYSAAWLVAACARALAELDPAWVRTSIGRYLQKVNGLGYAEMTRRYEVLAKL